MTVLLIVDTAVTHVHTILAHLQTGNLHGTDEPLRVYLTCTHVLQAAQLPEAAGILAAAHALLQARAAAIEDVDGRRHYLENVPYHREIMALWSAS